MVAITMSDEVQSMEEAVKFVIDATETGIELKDIREIVGGLFGGMPWYKREQIPLILVNFVKTGKALYYTSEGKMFYYKSKQ